MSKVIPQIIEWDFVQLEYHGAGDNTVDEVEELLEETDYSIDKDWLQLNLFKSDVKQIAHDGDYILVQKEIGIALVLNELEMTRMFRKIFRSN